MFLAVVRVTQSVHANRRKKNDFNNSLPSSTSIYRLTTAIGRNWLARTRPAPACWRLFFRALPSARAASKVKTTTQTIRGLKGKRPVVATTAYDFIMARLAGEAGIDLILVGDSVGTTSLGLPTTVQVDLEAMLHHTRAVSRAQPPSLVVTDIPFAEAHRPEDRLLDACARCLQEGGAEAVKIEGGAEMAPRIALLTRAGIPVLGHIGLLPQQVYQLGGYRKFGKTKAEREQLIRDAAAIEAAGAFAIVGEMIEAEAAAEIASSLTIPLIGIGSGPKCDGQILVCYDLLGLTQGKTPPFAKAYAHLSGEAAKAFQAYAEEVKKGAFPS
jgi:3-methyl-2-oxobutanoate hydroxymethyltransferase